MIQALLTTGSGASSCLHITHGTPVSNPTAIPTAHFKYAEPAAPSFFSVVPYSFSIYAGGKQSRTAVLWGLGAVNIVLQFFSFKLSLKSEYIFQYIKNNIKKQVIIPHDLNNMYLR